MTVSIAECLAPTRSPRKPVTEFPAGSVDTHVHVWEIDPPRYPVGPTAPNFTSLPDEPARVDELVGDMDGVVKINLSPNSIKTSTSNASFVSKLIEGKFPDYEQVVPSGDSSKLTVSTKDFSDVLSRVSVLSSDKYRGIRMVASSEGVMISANNPDQEEGEEFYKTKYEGEAIDIAFNVNYFQEILSTLDDDECEIHFFGADKSCLITPPNSQHLKYVVMPLLI